MRVPETGKKGDSRLVVCWCVSCVKDRDRKEAVKGCVL